MESGKLRRDIFYRLASIMIEIPPLRERGEDIEELVRHYLAEKPVVEIEQGVWDRLHAHKWPGNVRELFHILDYVLNVCEAASCASAICRRIFRPRRMLRHRKRTARRKRRKSSGGAAMPRG